MEECTINELLINDEIRASEVRLIDTDGTMLGIMSFKDAYAKAADKELDLVQISPNAVPPVCKIMDYDKYRYDQIKKEKEAKKNQKVVETKEIRFSPNIDDHDIETKVKMAQKFLKDGDKVKVSVRFRGREMTHTELGKEVLDAFLERIKDEVVVDKAAAMEGRSMAMFLSPKKK